MNAFRKLPRRRIKISAKLIPAGKTKIIIVVGPTASGKSELAVKLAKKFSGEIISADSRQIYRGLDIGSGKVPGRRICLKKEHATNKRTLISCMFLYKNIPHHCIDAVHPQKTFTAADYQKCAREAIKSVSGRGKIPVIAGGAGFWVDAAVYDLNLPAVPPNTSLRKKLGKKPAAELFKILRKLDPSRAEKIERKNPRRLIRAIEIAETAGRSPKIRKRRPYETLWLGISLPKEKLKKRIKRRLLQRMRQGMAREAKRLRRRGLSWKRFYSFGLEYGFLADYLRKKISRREFFAGLEKAINDYARRQTVWFKKNPEIFWIKNEKEAEKAARKFLAATQPTPRSTGKAEIKS